MVSTIKCIFTLAVMISLASLAYAIRCYQCESLTSPKCGMKFEADNSLLIDCARIEPPRFLQSIFPMRNATGCMKKTLEGAVGHPQIVRTCYFGDISYTETSCQPDPKLPFVKQLACEVCSKDECNGSANLTPILASILLFCGLARILS